MTDRQHQNGAFTILELLIAVAITSVIVVLLGTMFGSLIGSSSRANQRIDAFRDARAALQMMERDLSNLIRATPAAYFAATDIYSNDPNTSSQKNRQLYALCALKNKPTGNPPPIAGDMCALGYYCRWATDSANKQGHYVLRRYFRDSDATFKAFQANGPGNYMSATTLYLPAATDDVLAANVWNLQVVAYKADGTVDPTYPLVIDPSQPAVTLPATVEISFSAMSAQAARAIMSVSSNPNDWMDTSSTNYQRLVAPNAYEFRTRIKL